MNFVALAAAFAGATSSTIAGATARRSHPSSVLIIAAPTAFLVAFLCALATGSRFSFEGLVWGLAAGVMAGSALPLAYIAFARGPIGVVSATIASTSTLVFSAAGVVSGATIGPARIVGLILCVISIVLVTRSVQPTGIATSEPVARSLRLRLVSGPGIAVLVGVGFGGYGVALSHAPSSSQLSPLAVARLVMFVIAVIYWRNARRQKGPTQSVSATRVSTAVQAAIVGGLDSAGNILFVLSLALSDLVSISLSAAMAPSIAALLSAMFLSERLRPVQVAGVVVGVVAVVVGSL